MALYSWLLELWLLLDLLQWWLRSLEDYLSLSVHLCSSHWQFEFPFPPLLWLFSVFFLSTLFWFLGFCLQSSHSCPPLCNLQGFLRFFLLGFSGLGLGWVFIFSSITVKSMIMLSVHVFKSNFASLNWIRQAEGISLRERKFSNFKKKGNFEVVDFEKVWHRWLYRYNLLHRFKDNSQTINIIGMDLQTWHFI